MEKQKIYPLFDIAKFGCALLILFYHYFSEHGPIPALLEDFFSLYAVAVALFMTMSGYFLFTKLDSLSSRDDQWQVVKKQVKRILTIYLFWSIPYLIFTVSRWPWDNLSSNFVFWQMQGWIFRSTFYTIWFMPSLALGILFAYFLYSRLSWNKVWLLALFSFLAGSLHSTYRFVSEIIPGFGMFICFSELWLQGGRGGIFFGMPLVILGGIAAKSHKIKPIFSAGLALVMMFALLVEAVVLRKYVGGCGLDLALSMIPVCFCITMFLRSISMAPSESMKAGLLWMRSMSIVVFMSQRLFLTVLPYLFSTEVQHFIFANTYFGGLILGSGTILFSALIIQFSKRFNMLKMLY